MSGPALLSIPSPGDPIAFSVGSIDIRWYALLIMTGIIAAIALIANLAERRGFDTDILYDMSPWVVFLSIAGARLYFVLLEWDFFRNHPVQALNIRSGGLSIHGAIIVGVVVVAIFCRQRGQSFFAWADLIVPGVALGQAIGRWGNWANQEAFGTPSSLPWAVQIDPARRPAGFENESTFHPTFLYESVFNLANALLLTWLVLKMPTFRKMRPGDVAAVYLVNYGIIRFFIERIRTDSLYIGPLPAAYWLSFALVGAGIAMALATRWQDAAANDDPGAAAPA